LLATIQLTRFRNGVFAVLLVSAWVSGITANPNVSSADAGGVGVEDAAATAVTPTAAAFAAV